MNTIPINIKTLTPIHIGTGDVLKGNFEYVYFSKTRKIAVIDMEKVLNVMGNSAEEVDEWVKIIDSGQDLLKHLQKRTTNLAPEAIASRIITVSGKAPLTENTIKEQLHLGSQKQATIPGSSLKGSIRTAILTKLILEKPDFVKNDKHLGTQKRNRGFKFQDSQIVANYLGKGTRPNREGEIQPSANTDLLRLLRIGDIYFNTTTILVKSNVINWFRSGWGEKERESSFWECIPSGQSSKGSIQIPKDLINTVIREGRRTKFNYQHIKNNSNLFKIKYLFKVIREHTKELVNQEIDFWEEEENPIAIGDYLEHLKTIKATIETCGENACVLRVGAGSGWEFMTGRWLKAKAGDDYILEDDTWNDLKEQLRKGNYSDNMIFPKTRKMLMEGVPLGFLKLTLK